MIAGINNCGVVHALQKYILFFHEIKAAQSSVGRSLEYEYLKQKLRLHCNSFKDKDTINREQIIPNVGIVHFNLISRFFSIFIIL